LLRLKTISEITKEDKEQLMVENLSLDREERSGYGGIYEGLS